MADQTPQAAVPPAPPAAPPIRIERSRNPQFSLRSMLIAMTAFAIVAALATFVGVLVIISIVTWLGVLLVPVALGTLAFYCRGPRRTFYAGAFVGAVGTLALLRGNFVALSSLWQALVLVCALAIASSACGFTALYTRRFLERRGWHLPPSDDAG